MPSRPEHQAHRKSVESMSEQMEPRHGGCVTGSHSSGSHCSILWVIASWGLEKRARVLEVSELPNPRPATHLSAQQSLLCAYPVAVLMLCTMSGSGQWRVMQDAIESAMKRKVHLSKLQPYALRSQAGPEEWEAGDGGAETPRILRLCALLWSSCSA